ncbi:zinc metalloprotease HtpX [Candidatus Woesearchaeota archaeon]|nr:zinc metalloprotease HtpX [Candidatus Woesearchaeota archaeon]
MHNQLKTVLFLSLLSGLLLGAGWLMGGYQGLTIGLIIALITNLGSYWFSDKIVLAIYRAKSADKTEYTYLHQMIEELAAKAHIPKPRIYIINSPQMNAFATGRNPEHAVVACTTGILQHLTRDELKGVLGHELSHITNRDILISSIAAGIAAVISYIAFIARFAAIFGGGRDRDNNVLELLVLAIITPILATMLQLAISRSREYIADSSGAKLTGHPEHLASALEKIAGSVKAHPLAPHASTTATAHLFISSPFRANAFLNLLSTHPPADERIRRLRAMK